MTDCPDLDDGELDDPEVPAELLRLGIDLDLVGVTPAEFAEWADGVAAR
jgi:hypothetical protein